MNTGLYDYAVPPGFGDTFFQYAFNGDALVPGQAYNQLGIRVDDGKFVSRFFAGQESIATGPMMIYDKSTKGLFGPPGFDFSPFATGKNLLPEVNYDANSFIRFDLSVAAPQIASTDAGANNVYASQLVFSGARRRAGFTSDPGPSLYPYYETSFGYTGVDAEASPLAINNYATNGAGVVLPPVQYTIPVRDYDFELRRVEINYDSNESGIPCAVAFKITLYDNFWIARSNVPIVANRFFHVSPALSSGELNFFPSPPLLYKVGSTIRFDIWSLLSAPTTLPQTFNVFFYGVRRIPCK